MIPKYSVVLGVVLLVDLDTRIARVVVREYGTHSGEAVRIFVENDRTFIFNELQKQYLTVETLNERMK